MRTMVKSLKRLYSVGKITIEYIENNTKLSEEEKKYILG